MESITGTPNSITVTVSTKRNEGGRIEYYIKAEDEKEYGQPVTKAEEEITYTYTGLEQNKKYNIKIVAIAENEQTAEILIDETLGSVTSGTEEGAITFGTTTWTEGKASTTISTNTSYTIQYQVNSTTGTWTTGTSVADLVHGDKVYARLWDGTNAGAASAANNILDGTDPSASISLSSTSVYTTGSITATVTHTDNESGVKIANCKWVYNTTSSAIGTNASSYTGGTFSSNPQTITLKATTAGTYYLHVLTTDVAGRAKETISSAVTVTAANSVAPSTSTTHTPTVITYTWDELSSIAKMISNNSSITNDTAEVKVTLNGVDKTIGVGDTAVVDGLQVRILGFNHDTLTNGAAYGTTTATGKAGISFEYVEFLTYEAMNSYNTNTGGWGACDLRNTLNETTYNSLSIKNNIKQVKKKYIKEWNNASSITTSSDYLWLLSCGEIWDNGIRGGDTRGYAIAPEGSQYKYYKSNLGNTAYDTGTDMSKKPNIDSSSYWWLRSPICTDSSGFFCYVIPDGSCKFDYASRFFNIAPGFSI